MQPELLWDLFSYVNMGYIESLMDDQQVNAAQIIINLEGLIKNHISSIDKSSEELKKLKEMLEDIFKNDPTYQDHFKQAKEANQIKQKTKKEILKRPQPAELDSKIKYLRSQIKESRGSLSDYLQEYRRMSGVDEIEGDDGEVREIVYVAKLVKKTPKMQL